MLKHGALVVVLVISLCGLAVQRAQAGSGQPSVTVIDARTATIFGELTGPAAPSLVGNTVDLMLIAHGQVLMADQTVVQAEGNFSFKNVPPLVSPVSGYKNGDDYFIQIEGARMGDRWCTPPELFAVTAGQTATVLFTCGSGYGHD